MDRKVGVNVLGIEQFELGHHHGGPQDHSRIIRLTYVDEIYTKLCIATYSAWEVLEEESNIRVVTKTGSIQMSPLSHPKIQEIEDYAKAMDAVDIEYDRIDAVMGGFPQYTLKELIDAL